MHAGDPVATVAAPRSSFVTAKIIDVTEGVSCPDSEFKIQLINGRMQKTSVEGYIGKTIAEVDGVGLIVDKEGYYVYDFSEFEDGNPDAKQLMITVRQRAGKRVFEYSGLVFSPLGTS